MDWTHLKPKLSPFIIPAFWLGLLGIAAAVEATPWGHSGHPSRGLILVGLVLFGAPLFGIAGGLYTLLDKTQTAPFKQLALFLNVIVLCLGTWFWLWWFH